MRTRGQVQHETRSSYGVKPNCRAFAESSFEEPLSDCLFKKVEVKRSHERLLFGICGTSMTAFDIFVVVEWAGRRWRSKFLNKRQAQVEPKVKTGARRCSQGNAAGGHGILLEIVALR